MGIRARGPGDQAAKVDSVQAAGAHLMGRVTYQEMAAFWPTSTSEYAPPMNEIPKVVFSKTLEDADWGETHIACGDLSEEIAAMERQEGNDVMLLLFKDLPAPLHLELVEAHTYPTGAAIQAYRPRESASAEAIEK